VEVGHLKGGANIIKGMANLRIGKYEPKANPKL
jgi:hypothetical protein